jgi:uncharacterized FlaG/YvyC family protein
LARNNEQKAQRFAEHLERIFQLYRNHEEKVMITEDIAPENEEIKLVTATEVKNEINDNINLTKTSGFDLTTREVLRQLPRKAIVKIGKRCQGE